MCGIAGKIAFNNTLRTEELKKLSLSISHRGPDDFGEYISPDKKVGFIHRRLAIIDLTDAGHQPMQYLNRYWITFNGEIYNYNELRNRLLKFGYKFKSHSDTEVILAMYGKYKEGCLTYFRGMFAFAIFDIQNHTIFMARDRVGKKPLKYYQDSSCFIFASELKAILTQKEVSPGPDSDAIESYLNWGYIPSPKTGFKNIYKLEPGHYMTLNLATQKLDKKCYWDIDYSEKLKLNEEEWSDQILDLLEKSTKLRMIADVPVGAFLSGGIDSSSVVAMMAKLSNKPVKTFTIGLPGDILDESKYAKQISDVFKTDHVVLNATPHSVDILPEIAKVYEEPFGDNSALITYMVSRLAREHVKVILNGDGGDENFAGYKHHQKLQRDYKLYPIVRHIPFGKYPNSMREGILEKYITYKSQFQNHKSQDIYREAFVKSGVRDVRDQAMYADFKYFLPDDLLTKIDMASMKFALECRSPYLDHKLVELAAKIPYDLKVKNGETKYILKKAMLKILPKNIVYRPKMGFTVPLSRWFTKELKSYAKSILITPRSHLNDFVSQDQIKQMLRDHTESNDFGPKLWFLLMLELWYRSYFN